MTGQVFDFSIRFDYTLLDLDSDSISNPEFDFDSGLDFDSDSIRSDGHLENQVDLLARDLNLQFVLMEITPGKRSGYIETWVLHRILIPFI